METLSTPTLSPEKLPFAEKSLKRFKVAVCDIDYTLVDFAPAHKAGIDAIGKAMGKDFADEVARCFNITLEGHRLKSDHEWVDRDAFDDLLNKTKKLHKPFSNTHSHKVWSRETWILLAAEKLGVKLDSSQVVELRDLYWQAVTANSNQYPDTKDFLNEAEKNAIPLVLMTGSDSILRINEDLSVSYDPEFSENYKRRRVEKLNLNPVAIVIGDPVDKPDLRYFDKLFAEIGRISKAPKSEILVVGDSQRNDLEVPASLGYPTLLITRD